MTIRSSSSSGIPFGGTSGRPANAANGQPYFNGDIGRLELYTADTGWQNIVQETPGVASATGHYYESDNSGTFVISGTNFVSGAIAYAVGTNGVEYQATTTTYNSLVQLTVEFSSLSALYEPYDIKVTNPSNLFGLLPDAFYINQSPVWTTPSGSLGSVNGGVSVSKTVASTDSESNTLTYASSDLPSWLSLNSSTGSLTGTAPAVSSNTTYSFTVTVSDGINAAVSRSFSIPVVAVGILTGGTLSSDSTYYYRTFTGNGTLSISGLAPSLDLLLIGGGGGGGNDVGSGGGAGGLYFRQSYTVASGSYPVVIGAGGSGFTTSSPTDVSPFQGVTSTFNSISANGGGAAGSWNNIPASAGGSGGGGPCRALNVSNSGGAATQATTTPTYGFGNAGGNADHTYAQGYNNYAGGGGGGGAGAAGGNGNQGWSSGGNSTYGVGGAGKYISQFAVSGMGDPDFSGWFAGGGGASDDGGSAWGYGGKGGGGDGNNRSILNGTGTGGYYYINGKPSTGGGGGGGGSLPNSASHGGNGNMGGNGGSGVMIIRYTKASVGE